MDRLRQAITQYDDILGIIADPLMAKVFDLWPMEQFLQEGQDWIKMMQAIAHDRLDAFATLIDLNRRIQLSRNLDSKMDVVQNAMQMEYLLQIICFITKSNGRKKHQLIQAKP